MLVIFLSTLYALLHTVFTATSGLQAVWIEPHLNFSMISQCPL